MRGHAAGTVRGCGVEGKAAVSMIAEEYRGLLEYLGIVNDMENIEQSHFIMPDIKIPCFASKR